MLYWIVILSAFALFAAGLGLTTTWIVTSGSVLVLAFLFLLRWAVTLAQRALQS